MITDAVLRNDGMRVLAKHLGLVEAERFISLMIREPFDYTEWQRTLYQDMPADDFLDAAEDFWRKQKNAKANLPLTAKAGARKRRAGVCVV
ncbi:MAG: hypothetical protein LBP75_00250 [Planctomycetota bacterium]|jgi:hypothetical protein|nr:hypothetical protein [Planctomycetota bacterium]